MGKKSCVTGVILQFSLASILYTIYAVVSLSEGTAGIVFPGVLLAYGPVLYCLNLRFLVRQRTMQMVVSLNAGAAAVLFAIVVAVDGLPQMKSFVIMAAFVVWLTVRGAKLAMKQPGLHSLILALDANAVMMVLFIGAISALGAPVSTGFAIVAGFAACVMGVTLLRVGTVGVREWFFVSGAFCLVFALVWVLMNWVAVPAGQGIVALWNGLISVLKTIVYSVWSVILFLASLIGTQEGDGYRPTIPEEFVQDVAPVVESSPIAGVVFGVIGILFIVLAVIWVIRLLGRIRVGGVSAVLPKKGVVRQRMSFKKAICKAWRGFVAKLRVWIYLLRNRNRALGVYYGLVKRCAVSPWRKREGETPEEFLRRLVGYARNDPKLEAALEALIPKVNAAFYARNGRQIPVKEAGLIRRRIGAAVRGQFLRSLAKKGSAKGKAVDKGANLC